MRVLSGEERPRSGSSRTRSRPPRVQLRLEGEGKLGMHFLTERISAASENLQERQEMLTVSGKLTLFRWPQGSDL